MRVVDRTRPGPLNASVLDDEGPLILGGAKSRSTAVGLA